MSSLSLSSLTIAHNASERKFHPKFCQPYLQGEEIILSSNEGTLFRIHSAILQSASGLLRLFLSGSRDTVKEPPKSSDKDRSSVHKETQNRESAGDVADIITLPFSDTPLERVLLIISAQPVPHWQSFVELEAVIEIMDYLDAPGPLSMLRYTCLAPVFLSEPIRAYGLGAKYGWEEVMQCAANLTLTMNLFPPPPPPNAPTDTNINPEIQTPAFQEIEDQLSQLPGNALYLLLKLHRRRRDEFRAFVLSRFNFRGGESLDKWRCECGWENSGDTAWRLFSSRLIWEIDQNPSGESILIGLEQWEESERMWKSTCQRRGCPRKQCERLETTITLRRCIEGLPTTL